MGAQFVAAGFAYTDGDLAFDPLLLIEEAKVDMYSGVFSYLRAFGLFGKSARVDFRVPFQHGRWEGLLNGEPASTERTGFADLRVRVSLNLFGAPAMKPEEFPAFYATRKNYTTGGIAFAMSMPLSDYQEEKLINLGTNRFSFRPQAGIVHTRGKNSYELTASAFLYTTNEEFFDGNKLEQAPLFAVQAHVVHLISRKYWVSMGAAYGSGKSATVNGEEKNNRSELNLLAVSFGASISKKSRVGLSVGIGNTLTTVGSDTTSFGLSYLLAI